ncbi:MAG: type IX secretion system PorP/SprF family membrane protein [Salibacteraceae bacterium]|jgi:type IX secretion system PorP/SprF family membrane protein
MKKMLIVFSLISSGVFSQEDIKLSTYSMQHILYSPSLSIAHSNINVTAVFREQWNVSGAPIMGFVSGHSQINGSNTFVSGYVGYERISVYDKTMSEIGISQRIQLSEGNFLGLGLAGGINSLKVDLSRANFSSGDDVIGLQIINETSLLGTGSITYVNTNISMNASIGMRDVIGTQNMFGYLSKKFELNTKFDLDLSTLTKYSLNTSKFEFDGTVMATYNNMISLGATIRNQNQIVGLVQLNYKDKVKIGYAYDYHYGSLTGFNAHEIVLRVLIPGTKQMSRSKIGFTNPRI